MSNKIIAFGGTGYAFVLDMSTDLVYCHSVAVFNSEVFSMATFKDGDYLGVLNKNYNSYIMDNSYPQRFVMEYDMFKSIIPSITCYSSCADTRQAYLKYKSLFTKYAEMRGLTYEALFRELLGALSFSSSEEEFNCIQKDLSIWGSLRHDIHFIPYSNVLNIELRKSYRNYTAEIKSMKELAERTNPNYAFDKFVISKDKLAMRDINMSGGDLVSATVSYLVPSTWDIHKVRESVRMFRANFGKDAKKTVYDYLLQSKKLNDLRLEWLQVKNITYRQNFSNVIVTVGLRDDILELKNRYENEDTANYMDKYNIL